MVTTARKASGVWNILLKIKPRTIRDQFRPTFQILTSGHPWNTTKQWSCFNHTTKPVFFVLGKNKAGYQFVKQLNIFLQTMTDGTNSSSRSIIVNKSLPHLVFAKTKHFFDVSMANTIPRRLSQEKMQKLKFYSTKPKFFGPSCQKAQKKLVRATRYSSASCWEQTQSPVPSACSQKCLPLLFFPERHKRRQNSRRHQRGKTPEPFSIKRKRHLRPVEPNHPLSSVDFWTNWCQWF